MKITIYTEAIDNDILKEIVKQLDAQRIRNNEKIKDTKTSNQEVSRLFQQNGDLTAEIYIAEAKINR